MKRRVGFSLSELTTVSRMLFVLKFDLIESWRDKTSSFSKSKSPSNELIEFKKIGFNSSEYLRKIVFLLLIFLILFNTSSTKVSKRLFLIFCLKQQKGSNDSYSTHSAPQTPKSR
ncbi:hypothetical protein BpHYR1_050882 [Brachionus plicatilis]|uniref:Uncharacterized protein n=1 Tax=Brachionus plicatilis TaxID=10195 RepID=A0A3M7SJX4_BRAPC|nr:hypothetical protein BpHYR1_050882 [Brachionus plicatilis]